MKIQRAEAVQTPVRGGGRAARGQGGEGKRGCAGGGGEGEGEGERCGRAGRGDSGGRLGVGAGRPQAPLPPAPGWPGRSTARRPLNDRVALLRPGPAQAGALLLPVGGHRRAPHRPASGLAALRPGVCLPVPAPVPASACLPAPRPDARARMRERVSGRSDCRRRASQRSVSGARKPRARACACARLRDEADMRLRRSARVSPAAAASAARRHHHRHHRRTGWLTAAQRRSSASPGSTIFSSTSDSGRPAPARAVFPYFQAVR